MDASQTSRLLIGVATAVLMVVGLITRARLHAFPALLLAATGLALAEGLSPQATVTSLTTGFGATLGGVGLIIGLGAMLGAMVESSGGARRLAQGVMRLSGPVGATWLIAGVAMVVGAPLFFETGVIVMMPLVLAVGQELDRIQPGRSGVVRSAVPALAGLAAMHALVPPHPGPLIALQALHAPLGRTFTIGAAMALPIVALTGPIYGALISRFAQASPPLARLEEDAQARGASVLATVFTLLTPVSLILFKTMMDVGSSGPLRALADVVGAPPLALLITVLLGFVTLRGAAEVDLRERAGAGLAAVAEVLLVIGAGGAFKEVLVQIGIGPALAAVVMLAHVPPLLVGWSMAALVRLATGSSTVAAVTTAGAMAAAMHMGVHADPALLTLAIGGGSLFLSHVNDAGFWLVREYLGLSLADTFKTWSAVATLISMAVLGGTLVLASLA